MTVSQLLRELTARLKNSGIEDAGLEARYFTAHALSIEPAQLSPISDQHIPDERYKEIFSLVQRRIAGEPIQYLLGTWTFMGLPFAVSEGVLIPRADTEVLCEEALRLIQQRGYCTVLDLCCGSGCIGISLAKLSGVRVTLADISDACLSISKRNAEQHGVEVSLLQTDLFGSLSDQRFDLICCNPPYLTAEDMVCLQREVRHEPALALYGGSDGLAFYRRIAEEYKNHLSDNGAILLEIGSTQADDVSRLFRTERVLKDYAGNPRVVIAEAK